MTAEIQLAREVPDVAVRYVGKAVIADSIGHLRACFFQPARAGPLEGGMGGMIL